MEFINEDLSALDALLAGFDNGENDTANDYIMDEEGADLMAKLQAECEQIEKEAEQRRIDLIENRAEELARSRARYESSWKCRDAARRHLATGNGSRNEFEGSDMWA